MGALLAQKAYLIDRETRAVPSQVTEGHLGKCGLLFRGWRLEPELMGTEAGVRNLPSGTEWDNDGAG